MPDSQHLENDYYYDEENAIEDGLTIVDTLDGLLPRLGDDGDLLDDASELGLALGFGDHIADEKLKNFCNITEYTDRENMKLATLLVPIYRTKRLEKVRPFDKFVNDLCKGKTSIDDADY